MSFSKVALSILLASVLALSVVGCGKADPSKAESDGASSSTSESSSASEPVAAAPGSLAAAGVIDGTTYTNTALKFTLTYPADWTLSDPEETLDIQYKVNEAVFGSVDDFKKSMTEGGMEYLLYARSADEDGKEAANTLIQTGRTSDMNGATVEEYANQLAKSVSEQYAQFGGTVTNEPVVMQTINGREVALINSGVVLDGEVNGVQFDNYQVYQCYNMFIENDTFVAIMISSYNEAQSKAALDTLNGMTFTE